MNGQVTTDRAGPHTDLLPEFPYTEPSHNMLYSSAVGMMPRPTVSSSMRRSAISVLWEFTTSRHGLGYVTN